jgi:hypothetical protein
MVDAKWYEMTTLPNNLRPRNGNNLLGFITEENLDDSYGTDGFGFYSSLDLPFQPVKVGISP